MSVETPAQPVKFTLKDYKSDLHNDWCPGCGDFGILTGVQMALASLNLDPDKVACFSGIGCSGKTPHYIKAYGFHTLHGRVLPVATGGRRGVGDWDGGPGQLGTGPCWPLMPKSGPSGGPGQLRTIQSTTFGMASSTSGTVIVRGDSWIFGSTVGSTRLLPQNVRPIRRNM